MNIKEYVQKVLEDVIKDFKKNPFIFLTESDVQSYIYMKYMKFLEEINSMDACIKGGDWKSYRIHTEIPITQNGSTRDKLIFRGGDAPGERCDIVIFHRHSLDINNKCLKSGKGFKAGAPEVIIEIKLRRRGVKYNNYAYAIQRDIDKLKEIKTRNYGEQNGGEIFEHTEMFVFALDQNFEALNKDDKDSLYKSAKRENIYFTYTSVN